MKEIVEYTKFAAVTETQTIVSSTTLTDIPQLSLPVADNGIYQFELQLNMGIEDVASGYKVSADGTMAGTIVAMSTVWETAQAGTPFLLAHLRTSYQVDNLGTVNATMTRLFYRATGTLTVTTPGDFTPQFAQNASNAGDLQVLAGSYLRMQRLR